MGTKKNRDNRNDFLKRAVTGFFLGLFFYYTFFHFPPFIFSSILICVLIIIAFIEWPRVFSLRDPRFWLIFPIYPTIPFIATIALNQSFDFRILIVLIGIISFSFDFGAYSLGSMIGKHKLAPDISPRKTWEGVLGGYLFSFVAVLCITWYTGAQTSILMKLFITFCLGSLALCGDLFESALKRQAGIKDTGSFLPGHGGFLDRFDSVMISMTVVYLFREFFIRVFF